MCVAVRASVEPVMPRAYLLQRAKEGTLAADENAEARAQCARAGIELPAHTTSDAIIIALATIEANLFGLIDQTDPKWRDIATTTEGKKFIDDADIAILSRKNAVQHDIKMLLSGPQYMGMDATRSSFGPTTVSSYLSGTAESYLSKPTYAEELDANTEFSQYIDTEYSYPFNITELADLTNKMTNNPYQIDLFDMPSKQPVVDISLTAPFNISQLTKTGKSVDRHISDRPQFTISDTSDNLDLLFNLANIMCTSIAIINEVIAIDSEKYKQISAIERKVKYSLSHLRLMNKETINKDDVTNMYPIIARLDANIIPTNWSIESVNAIIPSYTISAGTFVAELIETISLVPSVPNVVDIIEKVQHTSNELKSFLKLCVKDTRDVLQLFNSINININKHINFIYPLSQLFYVITNICALLMMLLVADMTYTIQMRSQFKKFEKLTISGQITQEIKYISEHMQKYTNVNKSVMGKENVDGNNPKGNNPKGKNDALLASKPITLAVAKPKAAAAAAKPKAAKPKAEDPIAEAEPAVRAMADRLNDDDAAAALAVAAAAGPVPRLFGGKKDHNNTNNPQNEKGEAEKKKKADAEKKKKADAEKKKKEDANQQVPPQPEYGLFKPLTIMKKGPEQTMLILFKYVRRCVIIQICIALIGILVFAKNVFKLYLIQIDRYRPQLSVSAETKTTILKSAIEESVNSAAASSPELMCAYIFNTLILCKTAIVNANILVAGFSISLYGVDEDNIVPNMIKQIDNATNKYNIAVNNYKTKSRGYYNISGWYNNINASIQECFNVIRADISPLYYILINKINIVNNKSVSLPNNEESARIIANNIIELFKVGATRNRIGISAKPDFVYTKSFNKLQNAINTPNSTEQMVAELLKPTRIFVIDWMNHYDYKESSFNSNVNPDDSFNSYVDFDSAKILKTVIENLNRTYSTSNPSFSDKTEKVIDVGIVLKMLNGQSSCLPIIKAPEGESMDKEVPYVIGTYTLETKTTYFELAREFMELYKITESDKSLTEMRIVFSEFKSMYDTNIEKISLCMNEYIKINDALTEGPVEIWRQLF
jgi:hypothetical protein